MSHGGQPIFVENQGFHIIPYGDRAPVYPVELAIEMYRAIPRSALWVVPNGGPRAINLLILAAPV